MGKIDKLVEMLGGYVNPLPRVSLSPLQVGRAVMLRTDSSHQDEAVVIGQIVELTSTEVVFSHGALGGYRVNYSGVLRLKSVESLEPISEPFSVALRTIREVYTWKYLIPSKGDTRLKR